MDKLASGELVRKKKGGALAQILAEAFPSKIISR